jgi:hypothetical protein
MHDKLVTFLETPTAENYLAARSALAGAGKSVRLVAEMQEAECLYREGQFEALRKLVDELIPSAALSPRLHYFSARAHRELGHGEDAELSEFMFDACLQGLLATGEGTPESPYLVAMTSDQYDILRALGLTPHRQKLVERDGKRCDCILCENGAEMWFDVTEVTLPDADRTARTRRDAASSVPAPHLFK